jgi:hypothetical protein
MPTVTRIELSDGGIAPSAEYPWSVSGTVNVGDVVALSAAAPKTLIRADADNASARPPIGICIGRSGSLAQVALNGEIASGLSGLTRGSVYYLSTTAGALTATAPGSNIYPVGIATSATELLVDSSQADLAGGGGGAGSVTSFGITSSDFTVSNSPITTSGNVGLALNTVGVAKGGTGLTSASEQGAMLYGSSSSAYIAQAVNPTFKNRIINGAMIFSQRSTNSVPTITTSGGFPVDRFTARYSGVGGAFSTVQVFASNLAINAPTGYRSSIRWTTTTAASPPSVSSAQIQQKIEGTTVSDLAWGTASAKPVVISFWVQSSQAGTYCLSLRTSDGSVSYVAEYSISAANTWERKTVSLAGPTIGTWPSTTSTCIVLDFDLGSGSSFNTTPGSWQAGNYLRTTNQFDLVNVLNATFYITGVQLEAGSVATEFEFRPQQVELALCQRYFFRNISAGGYVASGTSTSTTNAAFYVKYPQAMRATPTISASVRIEEPSGTYRTAVAGTIYYGSDSANANFASTSLTAGRAVLLQTALLTNFLDFSAEL